ncbi:unnamed protein product [Heligmosomoides polygyrus]|uniref:Reverse transcriptase domain-containing protein n=1 Tax=Heligmosomoides polygyrus TaxID=6339 RepID=A0A183GE09_HELPZ|nr:unnamed protein product [Heligmosomoides polygyrus]
MEETEAALKKIRPGKTTFQQSVRLRCWLSTIDAIHVARLLLEKHREKQKPVHIVFLDLEKTFDRLPLEVKEFKLQLEPRWSSPSLSRLNAKKAEYLTTDVTESSFTKFNDIGLPQTSVFKCLGSVASEGDLMIEVNSNKFGDAQIAGKMCEARLQWYGYVLRGKEDSVRTIGLNLEIVGK